MILSASSCLPVPARLGVLRPQLKMQLVCPIKGFSATLNPLSRRSSIVRKRSRRYSRSRRRRGWRAAAAAAAKARYVSKLFADCKRVCRQSRAPRGACVPARGQALAAALLAAQPLALLRAALVPSEPRRALPRPRRRRQSRGPPKTTTRRWTTARLWSSLTAPRE